MRGHLTRSQGSFFFFKSLMEGVVPVIYFLDTGGQVCILQYITIHSEELSTSKCQLCWAPKAPPEMFLHRNQNLYCLENHFVWCTSKQFMYISQLFRRWFWQNEKCTVMAVSPNYTTYCMPWSTDTAKGVVIIEVLTLWDFCLLFSQSQCSSKSWD